MESHIKIVAILHLILSGLTILASLCVLMIMGGLSAFISASGGHEAAPAIPIMTGLGGIIFVALVALSLPGIVAGIGMLELRSWGRTLGIIISALDLIHFPLGTALGIYGLWALLSPEGEQVFRNANPQRG